MDKVSFDQMRLQVGDALRLTPNEDGASSVHYTVQFIGALQGKGLITSLPVASDKGVWMPPGSGYVVRVLSGTHAYAFTSQVIRARATPYPHVHFQYPASVQARRVRKSARVSMQLEIELSDANGTAISGILLDLSMHGARIEISAPLEGEQVQLVLPIELDEVQSQLKLKARIRNREKMDQLRERPSCHLGVEFGELGEQEAMLLHYFIDHAIAEKGAEKR